MNNDFGIRLGNNNRKKVGDRCHGYEDLWIFCHEKVSNSRDYQYCIDSSWLQDSNIDWVTS